MGRGPPCRRGAGLFPQRFLNDARVPFDMLRFWGNFRKSLLASCGVGRGESRGGVGHGAGVVLGNTLGGLRASAGYRGRDCGLSGTFENLLLTSCSVGCGGHAVAWATVPALCWVGLLTWTAGVRGYPRA
jgi:hypothetical protein